MSHPVSKLGALWWPQTVAAAQPPTRGQRGKPSPESIARRAQRDQAIAVIFEQLPCKGMPRRDMWEQLIDGQAEADTKLLVAIQAGLDVFGDGFRVSGRTAERAWKKSPR